MSEGKDGEWLSSKFNEYVAQRYSIQDVEDVTGEHAKAYLVDVEGYHAATLGSVSVVGEPVVSLNDDERVEVAVQVEHAPIPKLRLFLLLNDRFERHPNESNSQFQERYERECYLPIAKWFSPWCDHSCKTIERRWYCRGHRPGCEPRPGTHGQGSPVDPATDDRIVACREAPTQDARTKHAANDAANGRETGGEVRSDWKGFLAADALVATYPGEVIDKRNSDNPGVAVDCPFRQNHGKSKHGKHQLYVRNADAANRVPVVKCQSETCQAHGYKWEDYLEALFREVPTDPQYWLRFNLPLNGGFVVPLGQLPTALQAMNERWAVVRIGGKTPLHDLPS